MKYEFDSYSRSDFLKKLHIRNTTGLGTQKRYSYWGWSRNT